ncbi:hypothetical protein EJ05DRAFT_479496 [Pseudovirgaria hyperparasitica]|uniref:Uncharacterized protein n=1 Tax=Pseudovirgaria hyperparasitica TaxID=470096 RepID=A0A6A6VXZ6_9PEZI|nr:uncharacterized protein EJ05DRAFT_479496 [Pseudovirgaria hyperparasitica]KAF2754520.1 hypothetical protein EJ05DRAFT_479496 [Pseudovirgaria hyperparasitica]
MAASSRETQLSPENSIIHEKRNPESLRARVEEISQADVQDAVAGMADLVPGLSTYLSFTGARVVTHPVYTGNANLNQVAKVWMKLCRSCMTKDAPLACRLQQSDLFPHFEKLYKRSNQEAKDSSLAWLFRDVREFKLGCAHCRGDPNYCIPMNERCEMALYVRRNLYNEYWPGQEARGGLGCYDGERFDLATREQIEDAIARGVERAT